MLVEGKAIQVHPLVCHAFNADFDGDQMAVHLPLSAEAQAEARILMLSSNNILSPAHGAPLATPTQDMILGAYYLTYGLEADELSKIDRATYEPRPHVFRTAQEAELSYEAGVVKLHDIAEFRPMGREGGHLLTTVGRIIYNDRIERALAEALGEQFDASKYVYVNQSMKKRDTTRLIDALVQTYGATTISLVLDAFKDLGFKYATQAGITISKNDVVIPPEKQSILDKYDKLVGDITDQYDMGLITQEERHEAVVEKWNAATDEVAEAMIQNLDTLNPIFMMANSGARGSFKQIRQLAGMRGLMANPKGEIIERPIKSNFMEGLSVLEYFISTHGARKGLADTALRTADSGYLTRRLVDVAQDVIIREVDCGTDEYIEMTVWNDGREPNENLVGRTAAQPITTKRGRMLAEGGRGNRTSAARRHGGGVRRRSREGRARDGSGSLGAEVQGAQRRLPGLLRPCNGHRPDRPDRRCGGNRGCAVDRRARYAADDAHLPHRWRRRRGHHPRSPARGGAVRGTQAKGLGQDRRAGRSRLDRGDREGPDGGHHRRGRRGASPRVSTAHTPVRDKSGEKIAGRQAAQRGIAVSTRASCDPRTHRDRAVLGQGGAGGLQVPGRGHQRQAHRADRASDAQEGAASTRRATPTTCPGSSWTATNSPSPTTL